jgi:hypothetical protein
MRSWLIWVLLAVLLVSCSGQVWYRSVDPAFDPYYSDCPRHWVYSPRCYDCHYW